MSTTRRRVIIGGAVVLMCGLVGLVAVQRPRHHVTCSVQGYLTNIHGIMARVCVSNAGPNTLLVSIAPEFEHADEPSLLNTGVVMVKLLLLPDRRPCRVSIHTYCRAEPTLDRAQSFLANHVYWPHDTATLDIPK